MSHTGNSIERVMLYDGVCGLCNGAVQFVIRHDRAKTLRFSALQSPYGQNTIARHDTLKNVDSVVLVEREGGKERVFIRSTAALKIADYMGGFWKLALAAYIIPRPIRDFFYDLVAKYRYRFFGKHDACLLPPPDVRARFIE
ncbi:MAG: thiol-disulfide oxidoreductase [[Candidatus Thermochlorobacteriaceae] bacterium GBChlB]|nr:MAG: thiol-disulfide oxidoreductase [[Candidatus Thermochlorobacteriaceae] bacterium GBChlB]